MARSEVTVKLTSVLTARRGLDKDDGSQSKNEKNNKDVSRLHCASTGADFKFKSKWCLSGQRHLWVAGKAVWERLSQGELISWKLWVITSACRLCCFYVEDKPLATVAFMWLEHSNWNVSSVLWSQRTKTRQKRWERYYQVQTRIIGLNKILPNASFFLHYCCLRTLVMFQTGVHRPNMELILVILYLRRCVKKLTNARYHTHTTSEQAGDITSRDSYIAKTKTEKKPSRCVEFIYSFDVRWRPKDYKLDFTLRNQTRISK